MTTAAYPMILRIFHWSMAVLIIGLILLGFIMAQVLPNETYTGDMFLWHKTFGVVALILIALRIIARLALNKEVPPLSSTLKRYERIGAAITHKMLYVLMVVVPVSGYLMSSTYPKSSGITLFGLRLPDALPKNELLSQIFTGIHQVSAYLLAALIVLHIAAAIKHWYFD
jgi:cytochrome b561